MVLCHHAATRPVPYCSTKCNLNPVNTEQLECCSCELKK